jgi:hypothetical protein
MFSNWLKGQALGLEPKFRAANRACSLAGSGAATRAALGPDWVLPAVPADVFPRE